MKVQLFTFTKPYFSLTWKIDPVEVERSVSTWLSQNPGINIMTIKHDAVSSFWYPSQLFIFIYYQ
jgi:hypothetical protein